MNVDIGLGFAVHEVETEATLDLFDGHISSGTCTGGGSQIVAVHSACEVQQLTTLGLVQSELIGADSGLAFSSGEGISHGAEACGELGNTDLGNILAGNVLDIGSGHGSVGAVGAQVTGSACNLSGEDAALFVPDEGSGGLSGQTDACLAFSILVDIDVGLGFTVHEEEADTALNLFDGHINGLSGIDGGSQVVAVHSAGEVQGLTQFSLDQSELVGVACNGGLNKGGAAGCSGGAGDKELEVSAFSLFTGGHSGGQGEVQIFFAGLLVDVNGDLVISGSTDLDVFFGGIGSPGHIVGKCADLDTGNNIKVAQDLAGLVLVHAADVCLGVSQVVLSSGGSSGLSRFVGGGAACKHGNDHSQQQCPGSQFFHDWLLYSIIVINLGENTLI